jgi:Cu-processing system permease protein
VSVVDPTLERRSDRTGVRRYLTQVLLLAGLTWKEGLRRRMILIGLVLTLAFIALYGVGAYFSFEAIRDGTGFMGDVDDPALIGVGPTFFRDLAAFNLLSFGLFISSLLSAMLVVFLAAGMISGDAENGTLQTIVTRPVTRPQILLGRFAGHASVYLSYLVLLTTCLLVLNRVFSGYSPPHPVLAVLLLALEGLVVLSLVSLGSAALPPLATGVLALMAFGLAFVGGVVQQIGVFLDNPTAEQIGAMTHWVMPTDVLFRMALDGLAPPQGLFDFQMGPFGSTAPADTATITYALCYTAACLVGAAALFRRRDL